MKKIFTLSLALLSSAFIYAFDYLSTLSITSYAGNNARVVVDGNRYRVSGKAITLDRLTPGQHRVQVYLPVNSFRPGRCREEDRLVYNSNVYVRPGYFVDMIINRFGRVFLDERPLNALYGWNEGWNGRDDEDRGAGGFNGRAMQASDFSRLLETIRQESYDQTRMNLVRQAVGPVLLSSSQVRQLLPLFSFESSKLDMAKYLYDYCTERDQYYTVAGCLAYSSSKDELMRYIRDQR